MVTLPATFAFGNGHAVLLFAMTAGGGFTPTHHAAVRTRSSEDGIDLLLTVEQVDLGLWGQGIHTVGRVQHAFHARQEGEHFRAILRRNLGVLIASREVGADPVSLLLERGGLNIQVRCGPLEGFGIGCSERNGQADQKQRGDLGHGYDSIGEDSVATYHRQPMKFKQSCRIAGEPGGKAKGRQRAD